MENVIKLDDSLTESWEFPRHKKSSNTHCQEGEALYAIFLNKIKVGI